MLKTLLEQITKKFLQRNLHILDSVTSRMNDHLVKSVNVVDAETQGGVPPRDLNKVMQLEVKVSLYVL